MSYQPHEVVIDEEVRDLPLTQSILERLIGLPQSSAPARENQERLRGLPSLTQGKRILHLKSFKGDPIKLCPGYTEEILCCEYHVIDLVENCPLECSYCILQAFLNQPVISLHVNLEEMLMRIEASLKANAHRHFRVGTGEHSDSLAMDHLFGVNPILVERFARFSNAHLELKTKTADIEPLLGLNHGGKTLVGWSVNPVKVIQSEEFKTASLKERLEAAKEVARAGYQVSFHFDPLIHHEGWREGYQEVVEGIFEHLRPEQIAWISMGTLRYIPSLKRIAEDRFKGTKIFTDEFVPTQDGKMKYLKELRREMTGFVGGRIEKLSGGKTPLYLCMEKKSVWEKSLAYTPADHGELESYLCSNLKALPKGG